jgi:ABC-2 type transport system ATP-binding protein
LSGKTVITVRNLVKKFGTFVANDRLNFKVFRGEIFGFLGANGAGKTTTMRILCGLSRPTSGEAVVAGLDVSHQAEEVKKRIGYMSQKFSLYEDLTVYENMRLYGGIYELDSREINSRTGALLDRLQLAGQRDTLISDLPLGWRQKLAFAVAIIHRPSIVFLDEPTGGVDPITRRQFWDMIYQTAHDGITVFVTTHYMDEAEYCDRVSIMDRGRIAALGEPRALKAEYGVDSIHDVFVKIARPEVMLDKKTGSNR